MGEESCNFGSAPVRSSTTATVSVHISVNNGPDVAAANNGLPIGSANIGPGIVVVVTIGDQSGINSIVKC